MQRGMMRVIPFSPHRMLNAPAAPKHAQEIRGRARPLAAAAASSSGSAVRTQLPTDWVHADKDQPLYSHMAMMDRLPVPELGHTLAKYLKSVEPFLSETELRATAAKVEAFGASGGLGEALHARLLARAANDVPDTSWIGERASALPFEIGLGNEVGKAPR